MDAGPANTCPATRRRPQSGLYLLTTGRTVYHFHTRTKDRTRPGTAGRRAGDVDRAQRSRRERAQVEEGDWVRVESARGAVEARARVTGSREGVVFAPFHYGYWDVQGGERLVIGRAATS